MYRLCMLNVDSHYNLAVLGILRTACRTPRSPKTSSAVKGMKVRHYE